MNAAHAALVQHTTPVLLRTAANAVQHHHPLWGVGCGTALRKRDDRRSAFAAPRILEMIELECALLHAPPAA